MNRTSRAFSLIEMAMVISIMAVLAAIAAPRYANSLARYRADTAAKRIAADLAMAQSRARVSSSSRTVTFTPAQSRYVITNITDSKTGASNYTVNLTESPYQTKMTSANFGGDGVLIFNGFGIPDSGGTVVITCGAISKTVTLDATTGATSIQ